MEHISDQIRKQLLEGAEEEYRIFEGNLLPGVDHFLGVRLPLLRRLAKELSKHDFHGYFYDTENEVYFEELMLKGMIIGYADLTFKERQNALTNFIPKINNWSVCDSSITTYKFMKKDQKKWMDFLENLLLSNDEFTLRFAVVCMKNYFLTDEWIDRVLQYVVHVRTKAYYAQMSLAWLLCEAYSAYPSKVDEIFNNEVLDEEIQKLTYKKIRESAKFSSDIKQKFRLEKNME